MSPQFDEAVEAARIGLAGAVEFLRKDVGLVRARLLPYAIQLVLLVAFFSRVEAPTEVQREQLRRWFWSTSWSGFFAGANSTQVKLALQDIRIFASGAPSLENTHETARSFPNRFDLRSARVRTLLLWQLAEFGEPLDANGAPIDVLRQLDASDFRAYRHIVTSGSAHGSNPANRVLFPTPAGVSVRRALLDLDPAIATDVLMSHGIPRSALELLRAGRDDDFIEARAEFLAYRERDLMSTLGIPLPSEFQSDADIDTE
jgi:hypothetical protein